MNNDQRIFLGFDFSTQQLKVIAINQHLVILKESSVSFDEDLPDYKTTGGVHLHYDGVTVTAPTVMWIQALDILLDKLKADNMDLSKVVAISGSGQQHGSVYWKNGAKDVLENLKSESSLQEQLKDCFSISDSPVWMDASTTKHCKQLESAVGGAMRLAELTGSRAYERFTGNQISKIFQESLSSYDNTERISLVSSFGASLFLGQYAPIDYSDGSGMNLLDINTKQWSKTCLDACAKDLESKLGQPVKSTENLGPISQYYVEKYGFSPTCAIIAFTGDNPASLAGMRLQEGDICVSLGTSDTLFLWLTEPKPALEGHVFVNPVNSDSYMALLCFKNGSLTREKVREEFAEGSWETFTNSLTAVPAGNNGNIGIYFDVMEIQPLLCGRFRINAEDVEVPKFPDAKEEVRAVIEGQFLSRRVHAENLGFNIMPKSRVLATGGASQNSSILKVMANILNAPVYVQDVMNSASLGAAYQAMRGSLGQSYFDSILEKTSAMTCVAQPDATTEQLYTKLCSRYRQLEQKVSQN
ncbi:xylulose kinase-like [Argonauta hians]